jgi:hypothetical protein
MTENCHVLNDYIEGRPDNVVPLLYDEEGVSHRIGMFFHLGQVEIGCLFLSWKKRGYPSRGHVGDHDEPIPRTRGNNGNACSFPRMNKRIGRILYMSLGVEYNQSSLLVLLLLL